jgi:hypothetical protein
VNTGISSNAMLKILGNKQNVEGNFQNKAPEIQTQDFFFQNRQHNANIKIMANGCIMELWE